jgi:hypothetical protein
MSASGQKLGLRLFLEGIEVPVISAQIQIGINAPAAASVQIVPGDRVLELRARTMVHLFYWDYSLDNDPAADPESVLRVAETNNLSMEDAQKFVKERPDAVDAVDDMNGYKLLFCGEVIGVVMAKTPTGRQAVLQCSDFSTYWDTTYQFMASAANLFSTNAHVWAGGASMFDDILDGHMSVLASYMNKPPKTAGLRGIKGMMGGIIALLEAMGGVPNHMHGVNDFFTIGELKNHILQQIVCEQNDDTAQRLFSNKAFWAWLNNSAGSMGALVTFRDMLKLLFKYIYYEVVPNPAAMYVPSKESKTATWKGMVGINIPQETRTTFQNVISICNERINRKRYLTPQNYSGAPYNTVSNEMEVLSSDVSRARGARTILITASMDPHTPSAFTGVMSDCCVLLSLIRDVQAQTPGARSEGGEDKYLSQNALEFSASNKIKFTEVVKRLQGLLGQQARMTEKEIETEAGAVVVSRPRSSVLTASSLHLRSAMWCSRTSVPLSSTPGTSYKR